MIDPPQESDDPGELADWLELIALLSTERAARFDLVLNAIEIADDAENEDIAAADEASEALVESITEQLRQRKTALTDVAYPFEVAANGEALHLKSDLTYGHRTYLTCLVISHSWRSGKLLPPVSLTNQELRDGRNHFEVLSAVAALGVSGGPSFLLGTNRIGAQGLLERVRSVCEQVGEGMARAEVHAAAPQAANDDKVDVLAVELEVDGPPHRNFWFCQSAAGANFRDKPIQNEIERFMEMWFHERPANTQGAVFCPAAMTSAELLYETRRLGSIFHRMRMPHYAQEGIQILGRDPNLLQYVDNIEAPSVWLDAYLERAALELD